MSDVNPRTSKNWFANFIDKFGTAIGAKELGLSEKLAGGMPTVNTGKTAQSSAAGLDDWVTVHHNPEVWTAQNAGIKDAAYTEPKNYPMGITLPEGIDYSSSLASETDSETDRETDEERAAREYQEFVKEQKALAQARWQAGVDTAKSRLGSAKTYRDEMKGILGNKRGEFEKMFDEAAGQIGVGAAQRTGEAGRMAQDMATSAGNRARALGLTGTTAMQMLNKPNDAHARDVFNISQEKSKNENENRRLLGDRQDWATGQEADLDQYYKNVMDEVANLEKMSYLNYWNDLSGLGNQVDSYLQNMINTQNQMALMQPGIEGYDTSAMNPTFSNTMSALQGLSSGLNTTQMPQTADPGANSLVSENEYLKLLKGIRA